MILEGKRIVCMIVGDTREVTLEIDYYSKVNCITTKLKDKG